MQQVKMKGRREGRKKASLTVEASLVLPFFVFAVLFFMYFFQFLYLTDTVQSGITETGKFISRYEKIMKEEEIFGGAEQSALKQKFYAYLDKESINEKCIVGGVYGIDIGISEMKENQPVIEITAVYQVQFPIPFFGEKTSLVTQKVKTRAFIGQAMKKDINSDRGLENGALEIEDLYVYVTENGTVYHMNENCSHLKLSISGIDAKQIGTARNDSGGKYKPCEKCIKNSEAEAEVYIAKDGECYHNSLSCSGLKRTIYAVCYSEVIGKRKCSRCS